MKSFIIFCVLIVSLTLSSIIQAFCQVPEGGTSIIKDAITSYNKFGNGTLSLVNVTDQTFLKAFRFTTGTNIVNPWDTQLSFQAATGILTNDVILVTFFARTTASSEETGTGSLNVCIENKTTYDKVIYQSVSIGTEWKQYFVRLKSNVTLPLSNLNCAFHLGFVSQTIEMADIRFINYATTKTLAELPETEISYIGREPDAAWRAEAQERINQYRKGNIQVTVVDSTGIPVKNAEVTIAMTRHKFGFGSAIVASDYLTNPTYKAKILEMYNEVVFENDLKWPSFVNKTATQKNQMIQVLNDLDNHNIKMRGHNVLWPSWTFNPIYLSSYKTMPDKLRLEIDKRIDDVCTFTRGRVVDWDVINEPYSEHDFMDILGREVMADWFKRVRNNDPYVKLYLNDYAILSSNGTNFPKQDAYIATVKYIDGLGGGVQGIGFQGHFGSDLTPIPRLKTVLDKFSVLNKEIKVTEFDVDVTQQAVQADYTRDFMTMLFSHPSVTGILSWGFWESRHWKPNCAMYNADWSIRPNGLVYRDLILNQWWTKDTTLMSNDTGIVNFNGFLGTYRYTVKYDGNERSGNFDVLKPVSDGVLNEFIISTDPLVPAELKVTILGGTVLCEGDSSHLSLDITPGFSIKWFNNKAILPENSNEITVKSTGMYSAEAKGKGVTLLSSPVNIVVNSYPPATIDSLSSLTFCPGGSVELNTSVEVPYTYKWFKNSTFFSGSTSAINILESGKYKVEVNSYGCKSFSPELTVIKLNATDARCSTGIYDIEKKISVSPNPFKQSLYIDASAFETFPVEIEFIDINGKVLYQSIISNPLKTEILPNVTNGFYLLKMQAQNKIQWVKTIRQL